MKLCGDVKFEAVIGEATKRNWEISSSPSECDVIWTNLINVEFNSLSSLQFVNHFKNAQNLSNKAILAYHIFASGKFNIMPQQWTSAFQDIHCLVGAILLSDMYQHMVSIQNNGSMVEFLSLQDKLIAHICISNEMWSNSPDGVMMSKLLTICNKEHLNALTEGISTAIALIEKEQPWRLSLCGPSNAWIIKPVGLSCGRDITIAIGLKDVLAAVERMNFKCVVQKYIERPLLVRLGHKFDIRQWVLVQSLEPLVIYGFSECYARVSSRAYSCSPESINNPAVHLCNHAIQKLYSAGCSDSENEMMCETMMTQDELAAEINRYYTMNRDFVNSAAQCDLSAGDSDFCAFQQVIQPAMRATAVEVLLSVRDRLENIGRGFEWLGLDLMVTDRLEVLLLEVNVSPDISLSTAVTERLVQPAVQDLFSVIFDQGEVHRGDASLVPSLTLRPPLPPMSVSPPVPPPQPHSTPLTWQLWYSSDNPVHKTTFSATFPTNSLGVLQFVRSKRDKAMLAVNDYQPHDLADWNKILSILAKTEYNESTTNEISGQESSNDDDDEL